MADESSLDVTDYDAFLREAKTRFDEKWQKKFRNHGNYTLQDFEKRRMLGEGSFGIVIGVTNQQTGRHYAMKILYKKQILRHKQVQNTYNEKRVLQSFNFPFVVNLRFFFWDPGHLYFFLPLAVCGELFNRLRELRKFNDKLAKFYAAQVAMGLEYIHRMNLIYRDLKPENTVLFGNGYLKLTDFGFTKIIKGRTYTLCGTPEYMAPEIIRNQGYGQAVDWWAFGVLMYELTAGQTPFFSKATKQTYAKILSSKVKFPPKFPADLQDLVTNLVQPDLTRRYGNLYNGVNDIKKHKWFEDVNWLELLNQKTTPPDIPPIKSLDGEHQMGEPFDSSKHLMKISDDRNYSAFDDF